MNGDLLEINDTSPVEPYGPKPRKPIRSDVSELNHHLSNDSEELHISRKMLQQRQNLNHSRENDALPDDGSDHDKQMTDDSDELDEGSDNDQLYHSALKSLNCSRELSPERIKPSLKKSQPPSDKQDTNNFSLFKLGITVAMVVVVGGSVILSESFSNVNQTEAISNRNSLFKSIEDVKTEFYNQDRDIWNDISSGINEVKRKTPKVPSIILLFANETHTMDCLALAVAHLSSNILGGDSPLNLNPKDFGNDPGEIINTMKSISKKKAVIIRDVLNINTEAIKALHNLCDRINPLIREVVYIITMQTKNYVSPQKKMAFVEEQIYRKLSKSIDEDILMALVTRITDGAIILVQPEPNLRYCQFV